LNYLHPGQVASANTFDLDLDLDLATFKFADIVNESTTSGVPLDSVHLSHHHQAQDRVFRVVLSGHCVALDLSGMVLTILF
jgi:hypothetical protein